MTVPAPTRLIHAPWVSPSALPDSRPTLSDEEWAEICWQASERLYLLSGRQWAGTAEATVVLDEPRPGLRRWELIAGAPLAPASLLQPSATLQPMSGWGAAVPGQSWPIGPVREGNVVVTLPDPPVTEVVEVTVDGVVFANWVAHVPVGQVERRDGRCWPLDGTVQVTYRHGLLPPSGGVTAAAELAVELGRARAGDGNCRLPKRVTSLQREGVTVSLLDQGEFLDRGVTGLLSVDAWIRAVNPRQMTRRMSVWSPDQPRTRRA